MTDQIKAWAIAACVALVVLTLYGVYSFGYNTCRTEADLELEQIKNEYNTKIIIAQKEEQKKYEERIQNLVADVERLNANNADWLRKQDAFIGASRDLESCMRERSELTRLAVEGRELLEQATVRFKFCASGSR